MARASERPHECIGPCSTPQKACRGATGNHQGGANVPRSQAEFPYLYTCQLVTKLFRVKNSRLARASHPLFSFPRRASPSFRKTGLEIAEGFSQSERKDNIASVCVEHCYHFTEAVSGTLGRLRAEVCVRGIDMPARYLIICVRG